MRCPKCFLTERSLEEPGEARTNPGNVWWPEEPEVEGAEATRLPCGAGWDSWTSSLVPCPWLPCTSSGPHLFPHTQISLGSKTMAVSFSWLGATNSRPSSLPASPLAPFRVLCVVTEFPLKQFILSSVTPHLPSEHLHFKKRACTNSTHL